MSSLPNKQEKLPTCFLICPLGDEGSPIRMRAQFTLRLITEALRPHYSMSMADELPALGRVDDNVMRNLLEADLVIVDLSDKNPNVYFEFGIRYTLINRPFICICRGSEVSDLPFDVARENVIRFPEDLNDYQNNYARFEEDSLSAKNRLANAVKNLRGNPTTWETPLANQAVAIDTLAKASNSDQGDVTQIMLGKLNDLQQTLQQIPIQESPRRGHSGRTPEVLKPSFQVIKRHLAAQQYEEAAALATELLEQEPTNDGAAYYLGEALTGLERYEEAIEKYEIALRLNPKLSTAKRQLQLLRLLAKGGS